MQRSYQESFWLKIDNFSAITRNWNLPQCISDREDDCKFDFLFLVQYKRSSQPGCYHRYTVLDLLDFSAISDHYFFLYSGFMRFGLFFPTPNSQEMKYCADHYNSIICNILIIFSKADLFWVTWFYTFIEAEGI